MSPWTHSMATLVGRLRLMRWIRNVRGKQVTHDMIALLLREGHTRYLSRPVACSRSRVTSPDANVLLLVWRLLCPTLPRLGAPSANTCRHMQSCWWLHSCLQEALGLERKGHQILSKELQCPQVLSTEITAIAAILWL